MIDAVVLSLAVAAAPRPFALEDIVAFRTIEEACLSPDGSRAAFIVRSAALGANRFGTHIWLAPVDGSGPARQVTFGEAGETWPRFSPDGSQLAFLARRGESTQVWALPLRGGEARAVTRHRESVAAFEWSADGQRLLIVAPPAESEEEARTKKEGDDGYLLGGQWRNQRAFIAGVAGGVLDALTDGAEHVQAAAWSPDGRRVALLVMPSPEADGSQDARTVVVDVSSRQRSEVPASGGAASLAWSPDGGSLAFVRPFDGREISRADLFVFRLGSPAPRNLSSALDRDVEALRWTRDGSALDVLYSRGASSEVARINVSGGRIETLWAPGFPLELLERAGEGWLYVPADRPAELWAASLSGVGARALTRLNEAAENVSLPRVEVVRWRGPTAEIEGVLVAPHDHESGRRLPLLVRPHGGPRAHTRAEFDPQLSYFASQGFLVLQPNFRGSTGYGDAFTKANVGDWGDGPFRDVMAGVEALVARGLADPERLFFYGWSYSGYLANWAVTHSDRFRAVVSGAGVADGRMQYVLSDARRWRFDYFGGSPFAGHLAMYEKESPITSVAKARTPTLFVHGQEDVRCPLAQGLMMHRALKDVGVDTELLVYPREGHTFKEPRHILDRARRSVEWFQRFDSRLAH